MANETQGQQGGVQGPGGEPSPSPQAAGNSGESLAQQIKARINVPDDLREPYERIVLAGQKVLYSEETNQLVMEAIQGDAPIEQKLAKGIRDLMLILWKESNQSMPPQLIVPAAVELLTEAADFINETGVDTVDERQLGEAMRLMVGMVLEAFGATPDRLRQAQQEQAAGGGGEAPSPSGSAAPTPPSGSAPAPSGQGAPPGASSGIIGRMMRQQGR
ncbi:MAG: hypothetical protein LBT97_12970 [Planctomycetota bacterium]|jgi:hypothetical protein|nr:hypothetical protein [Planctomycetota bacterium]